MKYVVVVACVLVLVVDAFLRVAAGQAFQMSSFVWKGVVWAQWLLLSPLAVAVATAHPYRRDRRLAYFALHYSAAVAFGFLHAALYVLVRTPFREAADRAKESVADFFILVAPGSLTTGLFVYGGIVLATQMTVVLRALQKREEERLELERWLAQAALDLYKLQLPVELVNERLCAIETTIDADAGRAELLIEEFSAFLRDALAATSVDADPAEVARDEEEMGDEVAAPLSQAVRVLVLFGIMVAGPIVGTAFATIVSAIRHEPMPPDTAARIVWSSTAMFPAMLIMVWIGARVRKIWLLALCAGSLPFLWHMVITTAVYDIHDAIEGLRVANHVTDFLFFFSVALGAFTHARYRGWRAAAIEVAQLESKALRTRATILRLQLNPHFLFNTLNSIAALLEDDRSGAKKMTAELRGFVMRVLESSDREQITLGDELDALAAYVAIENVRFDGRVALSIDATAETRQALVPAFLLQPLVENALRHGLEPERGGTISIAACTAGRELHITVRDDGRSSGAEEPIAEGIGLANTRARLAQMYGDDHDFEMEARRDGFRVAVAIPFAREANDVAPH
ncbi:MAG TPA: histidine kinase [Thermoanaerobaculia bacterium]|nr:histidine kinase [Thermoanaerobaculia bacterium]